MSCGTNVENNDCSQWGNLIHDILFSYNYLLVLEHNTMLPVSISVNIEKSPAILMNHTDTSKLYVSCELSQFLLCLRTTICPKPSCVLKKLRKFSQCRSAQSSLIRTLTQHLYSANMCVFELNIRILKGLKMDSKV